MKNCIVNYATSNAWYPDAQKRLHKTIKFYSPEIDVLLFNEITLKSPEHSKVPYAFKLYAIEEARSIGYEKVIWVDSSFWLIKSTSTIFDLVEAHSVLLQNSGYPVAQWSSDASLKHLGVEREDMWDVCMFSGGFQGYDFREERTNIFFNSFLREAEKGTAFKGSWDNKNNVVSKDSRVCGHRHDMVVGSVLAHELGIAIQPNNSLFAYYSQYKNYEDEYKNKESLSFLCEGGNREVEWGKK
jgi:hypothetical protein